MAQAVLAREKIKNLAFQPAAGFASNFAEFLKFAKHCFMRECPRDAGHRYRQNE
jgi:hypothetical protein